MKDNKLKTYLRSGFGALYALTHEEDRITEDIKKTCKAIGFSVYTWTPTLGITTPDDQVIEKWGSPPNEKKTSDPAVALAVFMATKQGKKDELEGAVIKNKSVLILKDFHLYLKKGEPVLTRLIKDAITVGRQTARSLMVMGCQLTLPPELEKEFTVVEFPLPSREDLREIAMVLAKSKGIELNGETEAILEAGSGLTINEFADAAAASLTEHDAILPNVVASIKAATIKKGGILEVVESKVTLDDIGGLDLLKADLHSKRNAFTKAAKDYGLPSPRALLCCGNPGTGKSLTAASAGSIFGIPLLRLEAGRLFGSLVGQSEENWRTAFATAKAIAPVVVHIDEIDGLFAGAGGQGDSGTTSRVIKAILQDMQFNSEGIFFVFTANDIDALPDPLIDRCDVWNVELPNVNERQAIWKIHIAKRKRNPKSFTLDKFAEATEGFSGRQIEMAWIAAMTRAFNDGGREPHDDDVLTVLKDFVPTSITMKDAIEHRRQRLSTCAKAASSQPAMMAVNPGRGRKLV